MKSIHKDRIIRFLYGLFFVGIWLAGIYYILFFTTNIYESGSNIPTGEQIIPYNNHGKVVYITETQNFLKDLYGFGYGISLCLYIMVGAILQGVYKVEIFRTGVPWLKSSNSEKASPQDAKKG